MAIASDIRLTIGVEDVRTYALRLPGLGDLLFALNCVKINMVTYLHVVC